MLCHQHSLIRTHPLLTSTKRESFQFDRKSNISFPENWMNRLTDSAHEWIDGMKEGKEEGGEERERERKERDTIPLQNV